tara:strand:+ start:1395 stop:1691 length:297 start_codon:yes stop_codon:yes gene_type:complete
MGDLFLSADDGAVVLTYEHPDYDDIPGHRGGLRQTIRAYSPVQVADALHRLGAHTPDRVQHSSSMDFASEYGFNNDREAWSAYIAGASIYNIKYNRSE